MPACPHRHGPLCPSGSPRAVFLDRDGVLIEDTGYPDDPAALVLLPGVGEGLRRLSAAGWDLVVVTNQAGVARGFFDLPRLDAIHDRLRALLATEGVRLAALYFCPHHLAGRPPWDVACDHRKPEPGMLRTAARELGLVLPECRLVGDRDSDLAAAAAAGARGLLVGPGGWPDLPSAAAAILAGREDGD